jgi:hypothetical protein
MREELNKENVLTRLLLMDRHITLINIGLCEELKDQEFKDFVEQKGLIGQELLIKKGTTIIPILDEVMVKDYKNFMSVLLIAINRAINAFNTEIKTTLNERSNNYLLHLKFLVSNLIIQYNLDGGLINELFNFQVPDNVKVQMKKKEWSLQQRYELLERIGIVKLLYGSTNQGKKQFKDEVLSKILSCSVDNARKLQDGKYGKGRVDEVELTELLNNLKG